MKVDPNITVVLYKEHLWWALLHDIVAHPFMALTLYSPISKRFHNYTSQKAWRHPVERKAFP